MLYQLSYFRNFRFSAGLRFRPFGRRRRPGGPCGRRWIRTTEVERQQIYSLPHLATLVSARMLKNRSPSGETASGECRDVFLPSLSGDGECNALVGMPVLLGGHKSKDHFSILQKGAPFCLKFIYFCARKSGRRHFRCRSGFPCGRLRMPCGQTNTEHYEKNSDRGGRRADRLRVDDISARPVRECQRRGGRCPRVPRAERDGAVRRAERTRSACLRLYGQQVQGRYDFQPGRAVERRGRERPSWLGISTWGR